MKTSEVVVLPYYKNWEFEFEKIKDQLIKALDDIIIGIEHVGGTSVKGLVGNPIIDIDIIIPTYNCFNIVIKRLNRIGYTYKGSLKLEEIEAFKYTGTQSFMTHNLYVYTRKSKELKKQLLLRNYLNSNKEATENYSKIKIRASKLFPNDINKYREYKNLFILELCKEINLL